MKKQYVTLLTALFAVTFAHGDLVQAIGNLTATQSGLRSYSNTEYWATAFHTGTAPSDGGWTNFSLSVQTHDGDWPATGTYIELWSTDGISDNPDYKAHSFSLVVSQPSGGLTTVESPSGFKLLENHDYFVVIRADTGTGYSELTDETTTLDPTPLAGWNLGKTWQSSDSGTSWSDLSSEKMQVSVGVIPEPATLSLIALLGGGIIAVRRFFLI